MDLSGFKRFMSKVDTSSKCWIWRGHKNKDGYGQFWYKDNTFLSHRLIYEHTWGKIPNGMTLDHECSNPSCVNPNHLKPVSLLENIALSVSRRTHCKK